MYRLHPSKYFVPTTVINASTNFYNITLFTHSFIIQAETYDVASTYIMKVTPSLVHTICSSLLLIRAFLHLLQYYCGAVLWLVLSSRDLEKLLIKEVLVRNKIKLDKYTIIQASSLKRDLE